MLACGGRLVVCCSARRLSALGTTSRLVNAWAFWTMKLRLLCRRHREDLAGPCGLLSRLLCWRRREDLAVGEEVQVMPCSDAHIFHPPCLAPWLKAHNSCPVCRHELPTDDDRCAHACTPAMASSQRPLESTPMLDAMLSKTVQDPLSSALAGWDN